MKEYLLLSVVSILTTWTPNVTNAQLYVTATVGGVPSASGATLETFNEPSPSILMVSSPAGLVTGSAGYTAPYFSGSTAAYFGESPANGYDNTQYVVVYSSGTATLSFSTPMNYLGLLWGSVDTANTLTFYDSANNVIGTITGANILALTGDSSGDYLGPNGTAYVNITSTVAFSKAVFASPAYAFEFDDVAYAVIVPEPASYILIGVGLCLLAFVSRSKFSNSVSAN